MSKKKTDKEYLPINPNFVYHGWVTRVIDGDTVEVELVVLKSDCGFYLRQWLVKTVRIRLVDVDTPEVVGAEKNDGLKAKAKLQTLLPVQSPVTVTTLKNKRSFNRYIGWIENDLTFKNVNEVMINYGYGTKKEKKK